MTYDKQFSSINVVHVDKNTCKLNLLEDIIMSKIVKTGQKVPMSGQYRAIGSKTEVTFVQGKRVPPTSSGETRFKMVDKTIHRGK